MLLALVVGAVAAVVSGATAPEPGFAVPAGTGIRAKEPGPLLGTIWSGWPGGGFVR